MSIAFSSFSRQVNVNFPAGGGVAPVAPAVGNTHMRLTHAAPVGIGATQTSSAALIAYGLGWGAAATITPRPSVALPGNFMVPPGPILALADLNTSLLRLASRWWMNDREAERRVAIDAFLRTFLHRLDHAAIGVYLERALNTPGAAYSVSTGVAANQYIGHGDLDYVIGGPVAPAGAPVTLIPAGALGAPAFAAITARMPAPPVPPPLVPPPAPIWEQSLIIEAKRDLITQLPTAQWQICAILATQSQLLPLLPAPPFPRYLRGILTDGRYWAFYQLSTALPTFQSTVLIDATAPGMPAGVALVGGGAVSGSEIVLRMLRKYVLLWNQTNVDGWL